MPWQFLNVVEGCAACHVQVTAPPIPQIVHVIGMRHVTTTLPQVAQYPPLRVGRNPQTWAFTLENEYVRPSPGTACS